MTARCFETYKRKDEALRVYSAWLRLIESDTAPQGQWYCVHCHNNPTVRHPKDKLATMKTSVSKYSNLQLHENSARHKAVMVAIEQKNPTVPPGNTVASTAGFSLALQSCCLEF